MKRTLIYTAALILIFLIINFEAVTTQIPTRAELDHAEQFPIPLSEVIIKQSLIAEEISEQTQELENLTPPEETPVEPTPEIPTKLIHDVPFVSQAPYGDWDDEDQQDGCEETSIMMAIHWATDQSLSKKDALKILKEIVAFEKETFGFSTDTDITDTKRIATEFFGHENMEQVINATTQDIKKALQIGGVVVAPMQGQRLNNPNFSNGGPERHMLVIIGFNDKKKEFITNDPGTRNGEHYAYSYETIENALLEYPSGVHTPITEERTAVLIVYPL